MAYYQCVDSMYPHSQSPKEKHWYHVRNILDGAIGTKEGPLRVNDEYTVYFLLCFAFGLCVQFGNPKRHSPTSQLQ